MPVFFLFTLKTCYYFNSDIRFNRAITCIFLYFLETYGCGILRNSLVTCRNSQSAFFIRVAVKIMQLRPQRTGDFCSLSHSERRESASGFFDYPARSCTAQFSCGIAPTGPMAKLRGELSDQLISSVIVATAGITSDITYIRCICITRRALILLRDFIIRIAR